MARLTPVSQTGLPAESTILLPETCSQSVAGAAAADAPGAAVTAAVAPPVTASAIPRTALAMRLRVALTRTPWGRA
ncbi:hypothetical protein [Actinoplanes sp. CA-252034]|uniref:hypothetical protein n=1 Tax=Actinoplanes sp. CA-252034 TaxID=3239906 RepID=UPI003D9596A5